MDEVGVIITTTVKSDIQTNSGFVSLDSTSYRFGQPIKFTLTDPDLNLKNDRIDIYNVIDDPNSPFVDTVGKDGNILLEILIKDIRYKRCAVNGGTGGLASTGFSLVETGPSTGVFEGIFRMPSQICDKTGTKLISTAGGSLDAKYHDTRDAFGEASIFSLSSQNQPSPYSSKPSLSETEVILPSSGKVKEITLFGNVPNFKTGMPLVVELQKPDGESQIFEASLVNGNYKALFTINENSLWGEYKIILSHNRQNVGSTSFNVLIPTVPEWVKNNAKWWSEDSISNSEFIDGLEVLITQKIIRVSIVDPLLINEQNIPDWIKTTANWWSNNQITDDDFIMSIEYLIERGIIRI